VPDRTGRVTFTTGPTRAFAAYRGTRVADLTRIAAGRVDWPTATLSFDATAGRSYLVAVGTDGATVPPGPVTLSWRTRPLPPPNDDRADARMLTGSRGELRQTTVGATGEPDLGEGPDEASVWFRWRATHTGWEHFSTAGSLAPTALRVDPPGPWWATVFGEGSSVLWAERAYPGHYAEQWVRVVADRVYRVRLATTAAQANTVRLAWSPAPMPDRPVNDDLADATTLTGAAGSAAARLAGATYEPGESTLLDECGSCPYAEGDHLPGVWWRWTAPASGMVRFDSGSEGPAGFLALYRPAASITDLSPVAQAWGVPAGRPYAGALLDASVVAGRTYLLRFSAQDTRPFTLHWTLTAAQQPDPAPPPNDDFARATTLTGTSGESSGTTEWSTLEPGEPTLKDPYATVWYRWTAPVSGPVTFGTPTGGMPGRGGQGVTIWIGASLDQLSHLPAEGPWDSKDQQVTVTATAGTTYWIRVADAPGAFDLSWDTRPPPNDDLAAAYAISGTAGSSPVWRMVESTGQQGEPTTVLGQPVAHSAWLTWTPGFSGPVDLSVNADGYATVEVFTGDAVEALTRVGGGDMFDTVTVTAGTTYRIRIASFSATHAGLGWRQRWDAGAPSVGATLADGATRTASPDVPLRLTGGDTGSGLRGWYVSMASDGNEPLAAAFVAASDGAPRTITWHLTHTAYAGRLGDGPRTVYVQAVDRLGNRSALLSRPITLAR
jgi:hypothetical protein